MHTEKPPGLICGRCASTCQHSNQRMVKFTQQNGRLAYRHQCLTCGHGQGGIKNADVQDPDSIPWRDDPWPREPPKPCAWCGTWTAPNFTIGHRARVFPGGPGKTNSPENFTALMNDLESKIFDRFDDATVVHPGHGDDTTLGTERPHLGTWRKRGW